MLFLEPFVIPPPPFYNTLLILTNAIFADPDWPVIEDPQKHVYIRPEGSGLMLGLFEPQGIGWSLDGVSNDFEFGELQPDWER